MFANGRSAAAKECVVEALFEDGDWAVLEWSDARDASDTKASRRASFFRARRGEEIVFQRNYRYERGNIVVSLR